MSARHQKQARALIRKQVLPALHEAIRQLSEDVYADTLKNHPQAHAPEIHLGAQDAATRILLTELVRYLQKDEQASPAIQRWEELR